MKKSFVVGLLFISIFEISFAQVPEKIPGTWKFGLKAGANLSMFSASYNSEMSLKTGFHAGIYARHTQASERFHIRPEIYFSSQGSKDVYKVGARTETTINAINLPVLFETGQRVTFIVGPQFGFLLSGREKGTYQGSSINQDLDDILKPFDLSIVGGIGFNSDTGLNIGVRYNLGLTPVFETPQGAPQDYPDFNNRVIHFYIAHSF